MLKHERLADWLEEIRSLCEPDSLVICNGSTEEYNQMMNLLLKSGAARKLNETKRPNSYLVRSDPADVARVESGLIFAPRVKGKPVQIIIGKTPKQ